MKNLLLIIVPLTILISCDRNNSKPIHWADYYTFITSEEADLFNSYPDFDAGKITMSHFTMGSLYVRGYDFLDTVNTELRFGWAAWRGEESYIDYGNGDIDTLTISWEPQDVTFENVFIYKGWPFKAVDKVTISFNGTTVAVWDFIADPGLRLEIRSRNTLRTKDDPDYDPVVIILPKEPDWDELD
jgi:hypothetical protein